MFVQFFNVVSYIIGGRVYTLNDIESGILRANRKPVGAFKRPFSKDDPRYPISPFVTVSSGYNLTCICFFLVVALS